jgi:hypothetical protein
MWIDYLSILSHIKATKVALLGDTTFNLKHFSTILSTVRAAGVAHRPGEAHSRGGNCPALPSVGGKRLPESTASLRRRHHFRGTCSRNRRP